MDIAIAYTGPAQGSPFQGDWFVANGGLAIDAGGLASAVGVSLFTDGRAPDDVVLVSGGTDRRGWWADSYQDDPIGSLLWLLYRAKKTGQTSLLRQAEDTCGAALQWLLDDGVAASITVAARWIARTTMGISIVITEPDGNVSTFNYGWAWTSVNDPAQPYQASIPPAATGGGLGDVGFGDQGLGDPAS